MAKRGSKRSSRHPARAARCLVVALLVASAVSSRPLWGAPPPALRQRPNVVDVDRLEATARRAGLRVVRGDRLVLATDRPPREGDGIDDLPRIFAEAFACWCDHFDIDPRATDGWRAFGCLMSDREPFRAAGLLPTDGTIPDFANGYCDRNRFWLADRGWQSSGWSLPRGQRAAFRATGRCQIGHAGGIELESEADGISLRWYRGRPAGRLLLAQWMSPADGGRPRFEVIAEGRGGRFTAVADGVLYLKINEPPGDLADNGGRFDVEIGPLP